MSGAVQDAAPLVTWPLSRDQVVPPFELSWTWYFVWPGEPA